jgi:hypothetical protein
LKGGRVSRGGSRAGSPCYRVGFLLRFGREAEGGFGDEGEGHGDEEGAPDFGGERGAAPDLVVDLAVIDAGEESFEGFGVEDTIVIFAGGTIQGDEAAVFITGARGVSSGSKTGREELVRVPTERE